ncbi:ABC-2 family transporter protein [Proteiniclasticum sp.]|uniref:ABC transporter permease n=1 Tax=Proteiniclasticum sp. TaxID=2053595 RepID=UPI00289A66BC|nr:ABC-2 family transporter protein [Proteiniclasticum sp.]
MRRIKAYLPFTLNTFQMLLSYKANVIIFMLGEWLMLTVSFFLWKAIFSSSPDKVINGFTLNEMIMYIIISFLTTLMTSVDISFDIAREVKDGSIAINLIRPISYEKRMLFQALGGVLYNFVIIFVAAFTVVNLIFYSTTGFTSDVNIPLYMLSMMMGIVINFYFSYTFGLLSFKITNMWGMSQIMGAVTQLLSGALIPIVFFPEIFRKVITILPFSSIVYTPTMIYLGKISGSEAYNALMLQFVWIIVMIVISRFMWKTLVKSLSILGG